MLHSRNSLLKDIERWQAKGWIAPEGADAIRADLASRRSSLGLAGVLSILAAILVGFGVMSFVAANWQAMPKIARLGVILVGMWGMFAGAGWLRVGRHPWLANAALLAAVAIYGGGIMLIAQMYHMDGHPPDAVLMWGAGAVLTGVLTRANAVLAAALAIFCLWSAMETGLLPRGGVHWGFLPAWASVAAGFAITRWKPGLYLLSLAISGWIVALGYQLRWPGRNDGHVLVVLIGLALMIASIGWGHVIDRWRQISGAMLAYGFAIAFLGMLAVQFIVDRSGAYTLLYGGLVLLGVIATLWWAWRTDNRPVLWLAYGAFSIEILALYAKKIGSLLGSSAFFLTAGLIVAGLAWAAVKLAGRRGEDAGTEAGR